MKFGRTLLVAASILAIATPALAANGGGGGGGSVPSADGGKVGSFDPAKKYEEGKQFLDARDYKKAEKAFDAVLDVAARDPNTNYMMAMSQVGQQDFKNARKYLRNAVKYQNNFPQARGWLGAVEARLGDADKANEQKTALAALKTACAGTCPDAAKIDAAIAQIDASLATPDAPLQLSGAFVQFASAKDGDASYLQASGLINEGRYEDALYSLRAAGLALGPHADVLTYQGFANRKLHNFDDGDQLLFGGAEARSRAPRRQRISRRVLCRDRRSREGEAAARQARPHLQVRMRGSRGATALDLRRQNRKASVPAHSWNIAGGRFPRDRLFVSSSGG